VTLLFAGLLALQQRDVIDWDWLELQPRLGVAVYGGDFESDPGWAAGLLARAPMPWLSPASDPKGEYFGIFASLTLSGVDRDLDPPPSDPSGMLLLATIGADYTIARDGTWLLQLLTGPQFGTFLGVDGLDDGIGWMIGATGGVTVGPGVTLTLAPELSLGNGGDHVLFAWAGLMFQF